MAFDPDTLEHNFNNNVCPRGKNSTTRVYSYHTCCPVYWHWIRCLWIRNAEDKDWMFKYQKIINTKLCVHGKLDRGRFPNNPITRCNNYFKVWKDWAMRSQLLLTAVILGLSFLILYFTPKSEPPVLSIPKTLLDKLMELIEQYIR